MEDLPKSTRGDFAGHKPIGGLRKTKAAIGLRHRQEPCRPCPQDRRNAGSRPHACGVILFLSLGSPRTGGPHACHYLTAGSDSCARRRGSYMAARGARAAAGDAGDRISQKHPGYRLRIYCRSLSAGPETLTTSPPPSGSAWSAGLHRTDFEMEKETSGN
jgi:hypothetical protein